jgi:hypothetical protein
MPTENQSTYIPLGEIRVREPRRDPVKLIEVQSGSYLGEDDIVRFEDKARLRRDGRRHLVRYILTGKQLFLILLEAWHSL